MNVLNVVEYLSIYCGVLQKKDEEQRHAHVSTHSPSTNPPHTLAPIERLAESADLQDSTNQLGPRHDMQTIFP